jgi:hypothetical protein
MTPHVKPLGGRPGSVPVRRGSPDPADAATGGLHTRVAPRLVSRRFSIDGQYKGAGVPGVERADGRRSPQTGWPRLYDWGLGLRPVTPGTRLSAI